MRKFNTHKVLLKIRDGIDIEKIYKENDFHSDCVARIYMQFDSKHYALAIHHLMALVDMQLDILGYGTLNQFNPYDLDKLPLKLQELLRRADDMRKLPTCEFVSHVNKDLT